VEQTFLGFTQTFKTDALNVRRVEKRISIAARFDEAETSGISFLIVTSTIWSFPYCTLDCVHW
jgi:hypothetical protein